jgi:hypothetical protein
MQAILQPLLEALAGERRKATWCDAKCHKALALCAGLQSIH